MSLDLITQIQSIFSELENSSKYFVRKRVYYGEGGKFGKGLYLVHQKYTALVERLEKVSEDQLLPNMENLDKVQIKVLDTIRLISNVQSMTDNTIDVAKYVSLADHEVDDMEIVIEDIEKYDANQISDPVNLQIENIERLQGIVEDNLNQLTKSFQWKSNEAELKNTADGKAIINNRWQLMLEAKMQLQLLEDEKALETIGMCISKIRNLCGEDITMMEKNLPFLISFIKLFQRDGELIKSHSYKIRKDHLTTEDIRADLDRLLNTNRLSWIQILHETIVGDEIDDIENIKKFAAKLYELSRDPKEEFLWTMTTVARATNNDKLEKITLGFAVLASSLLSIIGPLEDHGLYDYAKKIMKMENIDVSDSITDLSELYQPSNINTNHLIRGLGKKLDDLKDLALQIIAFDDLAVELYSVIQYTDFNANLTDIAELEYYIYNVGMLEDEQEI